LTPLEDWIDAARPLGWPRIAGVNRVICYFRLDPEESAGKVVGAMVNNEPDRRPPVSPA
jgi:hypothetical protein